MGASTRTATTNSSQRTDPWSPAIPGLQQTINDATSLYSQGVGSGVYAGQRVADLTGDSLTGMQSMRDQAAADNAGANGVNFAQTLLGNNGGISYNGPSLDGNGLSSGTAGALNGLAGVKGADLSGLNNFLGSTYGGSSPITQTADSFMNGSRDVQTGGIYNSLLGAAAQPTSSQRNLAGVAAGQYLDPTTNPYLQAAVQAANRNAITANNESFAASGRYGSGAYSGAQTKAVNDTDTALYAQQYNTERANQMAANSQIDGANQAQIGLGNTIANSLTSLGALNNQQRLAGAGLQQSQNAQQLQALNSQLQGQEFNSGLDLSKAQGALSTYQQGTRDAMSNEQARASTALQSQGQALSAAGMLPALDALRYTPGQTLLGIGGLQQQQDQAGLNAAMQSYQEVQQAPWAHLGQYASLLGGIGGLGGTSTGTAVQQQTTNPGTLNSVLGAATGIGGLLSNLGSAAPFLAMLGGSDERMKDDIREVGKLHDGQPIYSFRYKGSPMTQIGLLAQEVAERDPGAVGEMPGMGGLLGVDYARATARAAEMERRAA